MAAKFKTKNQQLKLLREKNVKTPNGSAAILLETNYNELIKKYGKIFIDDIKSQSSTKYKKIYKNGTSVKDIFNLLKFDRKLANMLLFEILNIEEKVKSVFVYYTCELKGEFAIYDKNAYDPNESIENIVKNINYIYDLVGRNIRKPFINDDFRKYGKIPFYVLSEFITLGELYKLMDSIDPVVTIKVSKHFNLSVSQLKSFINLLSKFRNACAHNDVVFSYKFQKASIAPTAIHTKYGLSTGDTSVYNHNLFACFLVIKHFMKKKEYSNLIKQFDLMLNSLEKKSTILTKNDLLTYIGVPLNYKDLLLK